MDQVDGQGSLNDHYRQHCNDYIQCSSSTPSHPHPLFIMASLEAVKQLFQQNLRVSIGDKRVFLGTFVCVDKQLNIILTNTEEFRLGESERGRFVGMVMVPWKQIVKIEAQGKEERESFDDKYT